MKLWREDIRWYGVGLDVYPSHDSHSLAFFLSGASQQDDDLYAMWEDLPFTIQEGPAHRWRRVIDTSLDSPCDFRDPGGEMLVTSPHYVVKARSIVVLVRAPA